MLCKQMREKLTKRTKESGFVVAGANVSKERVEAQTLQRQSRAKSRRAPEDRQTPEQPKQQQKQQQQPAKQRSHGKRKRNEEQTDNAELQESNRRDKSSQQQPEQPSHDQRDDDEQYMQQQGNGNNTEEAAVDDDEQEGTTAPEAEQETEDDQQDDAKAEQAVEGNWSSGRRQGSKETVLRTRREKENEGDDAQTDKCKHVFQERTAQSETRKKKEFSPPKDLEDALEAAKAQFTSMERKVDTSKKKSLPDALQSALHQVGQATAHCDPGAIAYACSILLPHQNYVAESTLKKRLRAGCAHLLLFCYPSLQPMLQRKLTLYALTLVSGSVRKTQAVAPRPPGNSSNLQKVIR